MKKIILIFFLFILSVPLEAQEFFNFDNLCFGKMDSVQLFTAWSRPRALDYNKDGKMDFAVIDKGNDSLQVFFNDGNANFNVIPPLRISIGNSGRDLCVGDFDNDTYVDIATMDAQGDLNIFKNNTGTGISLAALFINSTNPNFELIRLESGELNNDGKIDIIGTGKDLSAMNMVAFTFENTSFFTFGSINIFTIFTWHTIQNNTPEIPLSVADFDGDGYNDFVVGTNDMMDTLEIYPNTGATNIGFATPIIYREPFNTPVCQLTAKDYDGDTKPDIAIAAGGGFSIIKNTGSLTFSVLYSDSFIFGNRFEIKDVDSDTYPDLIIVDYGGTFNVFRGTTSKGYPFWYNTVFTVGESYRFLVENFDSNNIPDFVFVGSGDFPYLLNTRNFSFHLENSIVSTNTAICGSTPVSFTVTNSHPTYPGNYNWNPGPSATTSYSTTTPGGIDCAFSFTLPPGLGQCVLTTNTVYINTQVTPSAPVTATVSAVNCPGTNVPLEASIPVYTTFTWSTGQTTSSIVVSPTATTTYSLFLDNGCPGLETYTVNVSPGPTVTISAPSSSICTGDSLLLTGNGAANYLWLPGSSTSGSIYVKPINTTGYSLVGTDAFGCKDTDFVNITVNTIPVLSVVPSKTVICYPDTVTLIASGAPSYTWSTGANTSSVSVLVFSNSNYTVSGDNGCKATAIYSLTGFNRPVVTANSNLSSVCIGNQVTLQAFGATSYTWFPPLQFGNVVFDNPTAPTTYSVLGISANGCYNYTSIAVGVNSNPTLSITSSELCIGKQATITAIGATTYTWNNGNTMSFLLETPASAAQLSYTVVGVDVLGCKSTQTVSLDISDKCGLIVWNGVTPNGDGKNDIFFLENIEQYPRNKVTIYNRWGQRLANIDNYDNKSRFWSGADEETNADVPSGTYYYIIDLGNGSALLKGWIELTKKSLN